MLGWEPVDPPDLRQQPLENLNCPDLEELIYCETQEIPRLGTFLPKLSRWKYIGKPETGTHNYISNGLRPPIRHPKCGER